MKLGIFRRFFSGKQADKDGLYLYVKCNYCQEPIRIRVNPSTDLNPLYEGPGDDPSGYELNKEIIGNRCFRLIRGTWYFDKSKRIIESNIEGGTEISAEEYNRLQGESSGE